MAEHTLRFKAKIAGKEVGVVAAITPPMDVPEFYGTGAACRCGGRSTAIRIVRRCRPAGRTT